MGIWPAAGSRRDRYRAGRHLPEGQGRAVGRRRRHRVSGDTGDVPSADRIGRSRRQSRSGAGERRRHRRPRCLPAAATPRVLGIVPGAVCGDRHRNADPHQIHDPRCRTHHRFVVRAFAVMARSGSNGGSPATQRPCRPVTGGRGAGSSGEEGAEKGSEGGQERAREVEAVPGNGPTGGRCRRIHSPTAVAPRGGPGRRHQQALARADCGRARRFTSPARRRRQAHPDRSRPNRHSVRDRAGSRGQGGAGH